MHMSTKLMLLLVCILSSLATADLFQNQLMDVGASNGVLVGGPGFQFGSNTNFVRADSFQHAISNNGQVHALQYQDGNLLQHATAAGTNGVYGVDQTSQGVGDQTQAYDNGLDWGDQNQNLGFDNYQGMAANGGSGYVHALDDYNAHQVQVLLTPNGMTMNISTLNVQNDGSIHQMQ